MAAAGFFDRIFHRIYRDFLLRGGNKIDAQFVADPDQIEQHVSHFRAHGGECVRRELLALFSGQPLKIFKQLGGFNGQCCGEVFRRVELIPIALGGKYAQLIAQRDKLARW